MAKKGKRKARVNSEAITAERKATQQKRHAKYGHGYSKERTHDVWPRDARSTEVRLGIIKAQTFEEEYRTFKETRGRRGLSPKPTMRKEENPVYLNRNDSFNVIKVRMEDLISRMIVNGVTITGGANDV